MWQSKITLNEMRTLLKTVKCEITYWKSLMSLVWLYSPPFLLVIALYILIGSWSTGSIQKCKDKNYLEAYFKFTAFCCN